MALWARKEGKKKKIKQINESFLRRWTLDPTLSSGGEEGEQRGLPCWGGGRNRHYITFVQATKNSCNGGLKHTHTNITASHSVCVWDDILSAITYWVHPANYYITLTTQKRVEEVTEKERDRQMQIHCCVHLKQREGVEGVGCACTPHWLKIEGTHTKYLQPECKKKKPDNGIVGGKTSCDEARHNDSQRVQYNWLLWGRIFRQHDLVLSATVFSWWYDKFMTS